MTFVLAKIHTAGTVLHSNPSRSIAKVPVPLRVQVIVHSIYMSSSLIKVPNRTDPKIKPKIGGNTTTDRPSARCIPKYCNSLSPVIQSAVHPSYV